MASFSSKNDKSDSTGQSFNGTETLGTSEQDRNPEPIDQPTDNGGLPTAPAQAADVGSATQLNAFRQELQDEIAKAHQAVDEIANKAIAYVDRFQQG